MSLIVAPDPSANSYISVVDANTYHKSRLHNEMWETQNEPTKTAALQWATRLLDELEWKGDKADSDNALRFPRANMVDRDDGAYSSTVVPDFLKNATAELAMYLAESDTTKTDPVEQSSIKVGPITITNNTDLKAKKPIPDHVMDMVRHWIEPFSFSLVRG